MAMVVGSTAAKIYSFPSEPKDIDLICTLEESKKIIDQLKDQIKLVNERRPTKTLLRMKKGKSIELDSDPSSLLFLEANRCTKIVPDLPGGLQIPAADLEILYLIKKSHIDYQIHWKKNINAYQWFRRQTNVRSLIKPSSPLWKIYKLRRQENAAKFKKPKVNLKEPNEGFFTQYNVQRDFGHDDVHRAVMYYDEPMYQKLKDDQLLAWCDWKKFKALAYEDQLRTVREEVYVIALERYIFPGITRGIPPQADQAFFKAMEIICTRLWTGKWAWFAINNFWEIVNYEVDYLSKVSHLIKIVEDKS